MPRTALDAARGAVSGRTVAPRRRAGPATPFPPLAERPGVSVLVPARDASGSLPEALRALGAQDYGGSMEVIVADGSDGHETARVAALARPVLRKLARVASGGFAAVHVRRGDRLFPRVARRMAPDAVRGRLAQLGVTDGAVLFVLSNERDGAWWAALARNYRLVRATDFPALADTVNTDNGALPDNYLLYAVEKEVMRRAALRVETIPGSGWEPVHGTLLSRLDWALAIPKAPLQAALRRVRCLLGERIWAAGRSVRDAWRARRSGTR